MLTIIDHKLRNFNDQISRIWQTVSDVYQCCYMLSSLKSANFLTTATPQQEATPRCAEEY